MWNGVFSPQVSKHRDYLHGGSYYEHQLANGATSELSPDFVMVDTNPIDESPLDPSREYFMMDFVNHSGQRYLYLIPAEPDNSQPNHKRIRDTMNQYAENRVSGGRDWRDYLDLDEPISPENIEWLLEHDHHLDYRISSPRAGQDEPSVLD